MKTNILLAGVGGQGVITLGLIIAQAAMDQGEKVLMSEIHGLAQRGGSVTVDVRIGDFHAPIIPDGDVDITIGMEPLETKRALSRASTGSRVVMSTEKMVPVSLSIRHEEYPDVQSIISSISDDFKLRTIDAVSIAESLGNYKAANIALLGFALGTGWLPISVDSVKKQVERTFANKPKALEINIRALEEGLKQGKAAQVQITEN